MSLVSKKAVSHKTLALGACSNGETAEQPPALQQRQTCGPRLRQEKRAVGAQAFDPFGLDLEQPTLVLVMPSRWRTR